MKLHTQRIRSFFTKSLLATAALGGFLLLSGAPSAKAYDRNDCYRRVNYTEHRYRESVERFGPYSGDARHWAHEREEARARCDYFRR